MKTTSCFSVFFASAALAAILFLSPAFADGIYTLAWGNAEQVGGMPDAALSNATQIAAGAYHSLALANGHVYGWGYATNGSLSIPDLPPNIAFIAAGEYSGIAISSNNLAKNYQFWGGTHSYYYRESIVQPTNGPYKAAALGYAHGLLLTKKGGAVHAWGDRDSEGRNPAVDIPNASWTSGFTAIAAGRDFSVGLTDDGCVHVAAPTNDIRKISEIPPAASQSNVTAIAAGPYHAMALTADGEVVVWGAWVDDTPTNSKSKAISPAFREPLPRGSLGYVTNVPSSARSNIVAISAGFNMCAALDDQGRVLVWGMQNPENPGDSLTEGYSNLTNAPAYATSGVSQVSIGFRHVLVLASKLPPTFAPDGELAEGNVGEKYSSTIPVRADPAATVWAKSGLPPGLELNKRGILSGTPTQMGVYSNFVVVASNAYGTATKEFTVVINDRVVTAPVWQTDSLPVATVGFRYEFQLVASNATGFSATQLPDWVSLSPDGLLSGTPAKEDQGNSYPVFTATNTVGTTDNPNLTLTVREQSTNTPPVFGLDFLPDFVVGRRYDIDLLINGASGVSLSGDLASSFSVAANADGAWILSGTPTQTGVYSNIVLVATNSKAKATNVYSSTVFGPPVWVTKTVPVAVVKTNYSCQLEATGATGFAVADATSSNRLASIPLALSPVGLLSGKPTISPTNFDIVLSATNAYGSTNRTFKFTVSSTPVELPDYRFLSIVPSSTNLVLTWTNTATPNAPAIAILVSSTNLLAPWPSKGNRRTNSATLKLPKVPTYYRLQALP